MSADDTPRHMTADEEAMATAALERFSVHELTPQQLAMEMTRWLREIAILEREDPAPERDGGIAYARRRAEDAYRRLKRMDRARAPYVAVSPLYERTDFDRARHADLVGLAETLLAQRGVKQGHTYAFRCPFHDDRTPSLAIYPPGRGWFCFGCGAGGSDAVSFVARLRSLNNFEALALVEEMADGVAPRPES